MDNKQKLITDLSREELLEVATNQNQYIQKLQQEIEVLRESIAKQKLSFYFKVIENDKKFNYDFVELCAKVIEKMLSPEEDLDFLTEDKSKEEEVNYENRGPKIQ